METAADGAAALGTVGIPTEDAWLDAGGKIRRVVCGHSGKHALLRIGGWDADGSGNSLIREQLGIS
jgi:hypothetical protein